ncbi:MAG TPA: hypothetical protein VF066_13485 [Thermoleophilaceae bacterium]
MTHTIISRAQSLVLTAAILATLLLVALRAPVGAVEPGACQTASSSGTAAAVAPASFDVGSDCAAGTSLVGYRMP